MLFVMVLNKKNKKEMVLSRTNWLDPGWFKTFHRVQTTVPETAGPLLRGMAGLTKDPCLRPLWGNLALSRAGSADPHAAALYVDIAEELSQTWQPYGLTLGTIY